MYPPPPKAISEAFLERLITGEVEWVEGGQPHFDEEDFEDAATVAQSAPALGAAP